MTHSEMSMQRDMTHPDEDYDEAGDERGPRMCRTCGEGSAHVESGDGQCAICEFTGWTKRMDQIAAGRFYYRTPSLRQSYALQAEVMARIWAARVEMEVEG